MRIKNPFPGRARLLKSSLALLLLALMLVVTIFQFGAPPITSPLDPSEAGYRIERNFRISDPKLYAFIVGYKHRVGDSLDRARVKRLSGDYQKDKAGKPITPGVAFTLRLTVIKTAPGTENKIFDQEINVEEMPVTSWSNDEFDKEIAAIHLEEGRYRMVVETTRAAPETKGSEIVFLTHKAYRGK